MDVEENEDEDRRTRRHSDDGVRVRDLALGGGGDAGALVRSNVPWTRSRSGSEIAAVDGPKARCMNRARVAGRKDAEACMVWTAGRRSREESGDRDCSEEERGYPRSSIGT